MVYDHSNSEPQITACTNLFLPFSIVRITPKALPTFAPTAPDLEEGSLYCSHSQSGP